MTAKKSLRLLLDEISEEDAARLLCEAEKLAGRANGTPHELKATADRRPISEGIREIMADVPAEELAKTPPSGDIDHIVYGLPKTE